MTRNEMDSTVIEDAVLLLLGLGPHSTDEMLRAMNRLSHTESMKVRRRLTVMREKRKIALIEGYPKRWRLADAE